MLNEKFESVEKNIKESILTEVSKNNKLLEDKMNKALEGMVKNAIKETNETVGPKESTSTNLREIMKQQHEEQIAEDSDRKQRACNIIIHGLKERDEEPKKHDEEINLIGDVGLGFTSNHKSAYRLGQKKINGQENEQCRPLKVVLNSEADKDKIMANLTKLKGKVNYAKISITEDFSLKERALIKEWSTKAKEANAKEEENSNIIWRVRGSPKNRLFLKKFNKTPIEH